MDKSEYSAKLEQIQSMADRQDVQGALEIVETIDWRRVKSIRTLSMVADIYEVNGKLEKSKEILLLAHHRSPAGKTILFCLAEVCIKLDELEEAVQYYTEYAKIAKGDNSKYILKYKIYRARRAPLEDQAAILEEYKEKEYTERWAFELARLYDRMGNTDRCVEVCDDLILWFSEGKYVVKALELKMKHTPLSMSQQQKYNNRAEIIQEPSFVMPEQSQEVPVNVPPVTVSVETPVVPVQNYENNKEISVPIPEMVNYAPSRGDSEDLQEKLATSFRDVLSSINKVKEEAAFTFEDQEEAKTDSMDMLSDVDEYDVVKDLEPEQMDDISSFQASQPEPAREEIDISQILKETAQNMAAEIQEKPVIEPKSGIESKSVIEPIPVIEPEACIPSPVQQQENDVNLGDTREFSFSRRDIPRQDMTQGFNLEKQLSEILQQKDSTFDKKLEKLLEESNEAAVTVASEVDEVVEPNEVIDPKEVVEFKEVVEPEILEAVELEPEILEAVELEPEGMEPDLFQVFGKLNLEPIPPISEEDDQIEDEIFEEESDQEAPVEELSIEEQILREETPEERRLRVLSDSRPEKLSDEQKVIFSYFTKVPGMDQQLLKALDGVYRNAGDKTSRSGNIAVMGQKGTGKSQLTDSLVIAICKDLGLSAVKFGRIKGEALNQKDPAQVAAKIAGGFLLIEQAGAMNPETIDKVTQALEFRTDRMIVIIEDDKVNMRRLLSEYPNFAKKFTAIITIPVFTNDELVTFAKTYAKENGYCIDDMGVLALYTVIGAMQNEQEPITISGVKKMVDGAIEKTQKKTRKLGRKLAVRDFNEDGLTILYEKDFV